MYKTFFMQSYIKHFVFNHKLKLFKVTKFKYVYQFKNAHIKYLQKSVYSLNLKYFLREMDLFNAQKY